MKIKIFTFLLCINAFAFAQNKAKNLLDDVSKKVHSYDNISIDFKYELSNKDTNTSQKTKGNVVVNGDKYVLNFLGATIMYDGTKFYKIVPANEEVIISSENSDLESSLTPSKMLTFYEEGYTYKMDIIQNVRGRKIQYVKLNPMDTNSEVKHVLLGIDANTKHIYNMIEVGKNGTNTTLTVNSFKTNQTLSKTLFKFDQKKYEDKDYYIDNIDEN